MHEAFFFGSGDRQIFAVYHPPVGADRRVLTVICPPLFAELNRTHSVLRKLAISLAERGQHVLRFDYSGTGDSFGRLEEGTLANWVEDISLAVQEGRELSGCRVVQILGVRASALLVCQSVGTMNDTERLVLWDPVRDGAEYLLALRRMQAAVLDTHHHLSRTERHEIMHDYQLYRMSESMHEEFRLIDAGLYSRVPTNKLRVVITSLANKFPVRGVPVDIVSFNCNWETDTDGVVMSQPVLESLMLNLTMK